MSVEEGVERARLADTNPRALPVRGPSPLRGYARTLVALDAGVLVLAGLAGMAVRGPGVGPLEMGGVAVAVVIGWLVTLALVGSYDTRYLGVGTTEFTRIITASVFVLAVAATVGYVTNAESVRGELLVAIPLGLVFLLVERRIARAWLHRQRERGAFGVRCLVVGSAEQVQALADVLDDDPSTGHLITAIRSAPGSEVRGWVDGVTHHAAHHRIDAVVIAPDADVSRDALRALAWRLSGSGVDLLVAPALGDLAGPRTVVRTAPRLPLVHLDEARLTGPQQFVKRTGDVAAASLVLLVMMPVLLAMGLIVTATSRGPALFRQQRVGRDGRPFTLTKIRTMYAGSEELHEEVLGPPVGRDREVTKRDPRITPVGRVLRRWSLDEFPQLWSVIRGDMSLVGPRPLMPQEMPWLEPMGQRRHLMRPGVTGLWQVNGRKEVDWADRIRLDVEYVERWSPALDAVLLMRTIKVILTGEGAR